MLIQLVFFTAFLAFDLSSPLLKTVHAWGPRGLWLEFVYVSIFFLLWQAVLWPLRWAAGWKLEKDFKMLKQDFGGWLADTLKAQALSLAVFSASALVFYATAAKWPAHAWWILACLAFGFSAFLSTLFPVWVLPLFYRSRALEDPELVARLQKTLERCGFPRLPLFELMLGEKTARANAMLTGFGKTRRALLSDTLLAGYTPAEIEMVLAHEAGHHALGHLWRSLALEALASAAAFFALFRLWGAENILDLRLFPALVLLSYLTGLAALPLRSFVSRSHERGADRFALRAYPDLATFASLMEKLSAQNLANPEPSEWEERIFYSHPSRRKRVAAAEKFVRTRLANSVAAH